MNELYTSFELMGSRSSPSSNSDSLHGLKFGKKIYFEDVGYGAPVSSSAGGSSSAAAAGGQPPPTPPKKGRTSGVMQGGQPPRCQVEGCNVDLSDVKAYYSRHKVCGTHSKAGEVVVAGIRQRFCQQCSRFHQLPEFDSEKRSCRRRLAGHNERRRKPPPGSILSSRYGRPSPSVLETSRGGGFLMDFSTYPRYPDGIPSNQPPATVKMRSPNLWQRESDNHHPSGFFLQGSSASRSSSTSYSSSTIPSGECFAGVTTDSGRALSLLSNQQPWASSQDPSSSTTLEISNNFLTAADDAQPTLQPASTHLDVSAAANPFSSNSWGGFKLTQGGGGGGSRGIMAAPPDPGLNQIPYMGLEHSRGYDSSTQHAHWSH